jgi:hypothetical protein
MVICMCMNVIDRDWTIGGEAFYVNDKRLPSLAIGTRYKFARGDTDSPAQFSASVNAFGAACAAFSAPVSNQLSTAVRLHYDIVSIDSAFQAGLRKFQ